MSIKTDYPSQKPSCVNCVSCVRYTYWPVEAGSFRLGKEITRLTRDAREQLKEQRCDFMNDYKHKYDKWMAKLNHLRAEENEKFERAEKEEQERQEQISEYLEKTRQRKIAVLPAEFKHRLPLPHKRSMLEKSDAGVTIIPTGADIDKIDAKRLGMSSEKPLRPERDEIICDKSRWTDEEQRRVKNECKIPNRCCDYYVFYGDC